MANTIMISMLIGGDALRKIGAPGAEGLPGFFLKPGQATRGAVPPSEKPKRTLRLEIQVCLRSVPLAKWEEEMRTLVVTSLILIGYVSSALGQCDILKAGNLRGSSAGGRTVASSCISFLVLFKELP